MVTDGGIDLRESAAWRGLSAFQWGTVILLVVAAIFVVAKGRHGTTAAAIALGQCTFLAMSIWRIAAIFISQQPPAVTPRLLRYPRYTVMAALYGEVDVVGQLIERLSRIDYPRDQLEAFLLLEAHDLETIAAARAIYRPRWMKIVVVPPGKPGTKPRALNHGLTLATGDLITIYDAEDEPDPLQLREAAGRFASDPTGRIACFQAPLRIRRLGKPTQPTQFFDRQFAVEYAALFEVTLPAMARLGLPFPLGGTSNHFRTDALRAVGGWDAWNVTEDADLGFRLWRNGWKQGVLTLPTLETPPGGLDHWLPQRTRWLKGYMQTWGVHTRNPFRLGVTGCVSLVLTLGASLASAAIHAATLAWVLTSMLVYGVAGLPTDPPKFAMAVLVLGAAAAWLQGKIGANRAGVPYSAFDMICSIGYWSLLTLAFCHAAWRLVREPFAWDKTCHFRDEAILPPEVFDAVDAGRQAA